MHVYIYDSFLNESKYSSTLSKIEIRITDLGLNGKIARLGIMKNVRETIENELRRGAKTIVAVGNDYIINEAINVLAGKSVPLGIIPINEGPNKVAKALGIGFAEKACDTLSARRVEKMDVLTANNYSFLTEAKINNEGTVIEIDQNYTIETSGPGEVRIINMTTDKNGLPEKGEFNPQDGTFELFINNTSRSGLLPRFNKKDEQSMFSAKNFNVSNLKNHPLMIADVKELPLPAQIKILVGGLNVIVGKNRLF